MARIKITSNQKTGLAAIVGAAVAGALFYATPKEESGRTVNVEITDSGATLRHVSGKQYLNVYKDIVGVNTACDGLTFDENGNRLRAGQTFTEAQCTAMLEKTLIAFAGQVMKCTPGLAVSDDLVTERRREGPRFAAISGAYNYGWPTYCKSTAAKRFNAGDYAGGCEALTWYNRAGGQVVRGLQLRRERERQVCVGGLKALK